MEFEEYGIHAKELYSPGGSDFGSLRLFIFLVFCFIFVSHRWGTPLSIPIYILDAFPGAIWLDGEVSLLFAHGDAMCRVE